MRTKAQARGLSRFMAKREAVQISRPGDPARWGTYFPAEYVAEFDAIEFEPTSKAAEKSDLTEFSQGQKAAKAGPFEVVNAAGRVVATYDDRWRAIGCLNRNKLQPSYVLQDGIVVARRENAPVHVGEEVCIVVELTDVALVLAEREAQAAEGGAA